MPIQSPESIKAKPSAYERLKEYLGQSAGISLSNVPINQALLNPGAYTGPVNVVLQQYFGFIKIRVNAISGLEMSHEALSVDASEDGNVSETYIATWNFDGRPNIHPSGRQENRTGLKINVDSLIELVEANCDKPAYRSFSRYDDIRPFTIALNKAAETE